jgi:hypothetical protein
MGELRRHRDLPAPAGRQRRDRVLCRRGWRPGFVGTALRVYNPATDLWSIFWFTNDGGGIDKATGHLEPPVVGRFEGNVGVFECDDHFEGQPIRVQYQWTRVDANHARWQQAFLPKGGKTWEVNWMAEFTREGA